jgi:hypothetical protein
MLAFPGLKLHYTNREQRECDTVNADINNRISGLEPHMWLQRGKSEFESVKIEIHKRISAIE